MVNLTLIQQKYFNMGFSEDMQISLKYTRSLRRKKNYFKDKAFDSKWGKDLKTDLPEIQKHRLLATNNRNETYLTEMREKSKKGLIIGVSVAAAIVYFLIKYFV